MPDSTSVVADTIIRTVELGLTITGAAIGGNHTWITCRPVTVDPSCTTCGMEGAAAWSPGPAARRPARRRASHPVTDPGTTVDLHQHRVHGESLPAATDVREAESQAHRPIATRWILQRLAIDRMSVASISTSLGIGWDLVNQVALDQARELVYSDPPRAGVRVLGVDEHKWKHRRGDGTPGFVTVIVDLTPNIDGTGPARLLDMVPGRSAEVLRRWLAAREKSFRDRVKVVAMDGFAGYHTATGEQLPKARKVMDPFPVVHLAADKLTLTRQRIQQDTCGHRGRSGDPLYGVRRIVLDPDGSADRQAASEAGRGVRRRTARGCGRDSLDVSGHHYSI
ncbi:Transposase [Corynebacterium auriscanis]|nr:Transposase [Corynebacterium auriscanis]